MSAARHWLAPGSGGRYQPVGGRRRRPVRATLRWLQWLTFIATLAFSMIGYLQLVPGVAGGTPPAPAATPRPVSSPRPAATPQPASPRLADQSGSPPDVSCDTNPNIFNTGYDAATGGALPDGSTDANWTVAGGFSGFNFETTGTTPPDLVNDPPFASQTYEPAIVGNQAPNAWVVSPYGNANWISASAATPSSVAGKNENQEGVSPGPPTSDNSLGDWYYEYQFDLDPSVVPSRFSLRINWYADNSVAGVWVNGVQQSGTNLPQSPSDPYQFQGYLLANGSQTLLNSDWQTGLNTIVVQIKSGWNFEGFDAQVVPQALCPTLTVAKSVGVRADPSDQFTVSVKDSSGTTLTSATTTGTQTSVTSAPAYVVTGDTYTITDELTPGSPSVLDKDYQVSMLCTDTTTGVAVIPQETGTGTWTLTVANPDKYTCTVTNTAEPADLMTSKTLAEINGTAATPGQSVGPGDTLRYQITTSNSGALPGTTTLTETVPANTTYTRAGAEGWDCTGTAAGSTCTRNVTLDPHDSEVDNFTVTTVDPLPRGALAVSNQVTSSTGDCTACFVSNPTVAHLLVRKALLEVNGQTALTSEAVGPGDALEYVLEVVNTGGSPGTTTLTETVPANTTYTMATVEGWDCTGTTPGRTCVKHVTAPPATSTAPGIERVFFTVTVDEPLRPGTTEITNSLTSRPGECQACSVTTPTVAVLDAVKTLLEVNGQPAAAKPQVGPGDVLLYQIAVSNSGGAGATTLTETVPAGSTYTPPSSGEGWTCSPDDSAGSTCTQVVSVAARARPATVDFTVTVDRPLPAAVTSIVNAVRSSNGTCSSCTVTTETSPPVLDAVKTLAEVDGTAATPDQMVGAGDVLLYQIAVTNSGGRAGDTDLTEIIPTGTSYTGGAAEGWTCSDDSAGGTCTLHVTALAGGTETSGFTVTVDTPLAENIPEIVNTVKSSEGTCSDCTVHNPTRPPALDVVKTLESVNGNPATTGQAVGPADVLVYHIAVSNTGGRTGTTTLTEPVPDGTTYTGSGEGWDCPTGAPAEDTCTQTVSVPDGQRVTIDFTVTVDKPLAPGITAITNAVLSSEGTCSSCTTTNPTRPSALVVEKHLADIDGNAARLGQAVAGGDVLLYHIDVHNFGGRVGTTTLRETIPAHTAYTGGTAEGWTCPDDSAGGTCTRAVPVLAGDTVTVKFTVTVDDPLAGYVTGITNTVTSSEGTCASCTVTNPTEPADLVVEKNLAEVNGVEPSPGQEVGPDDVLLYTITVHNFGGRGGTTTLTETVPAGTTYTGGTAEGWTCTPDDSAGSTCTRQVHVVDEGRVPVDFTVTVDKPLPAGVTDIDNAVTAASTAPTTVTCAECSVRNPTTPAALDAVKTLAEVDGAAAVEGETLGPDNVLLYHITVTNSGGRAGETTLTETVPAGTTYTGTAEGWTCAGGTAAGDACTQDVTVLAGGSSTVAFTVTLGPDPTTSQVTNTVESSTGTCFSCTVSNPVGPADLVVDKTLAEVNGSTAAEGETVGPGNVLLYQLRVDNTAGEREGATTLTETVPAGTTYTGPTAEGWSCPAGSPAGDTCKQRVHVPAGETATVDFTVTVDTPLAAGITDITNTVTTSPAPSADCESCTVTNPTAPTVLDTVKTLADINGKAPSDGQKVGPRDVLLYHISVHNLVGAAESTTLTETVPAGTTYTGGTAEGWACTGTAAGDTCTQAVAVGGGGTVTVDFTVTVDSPLAADIDFITNTVTSSTGTCSSCTWSTPTEPAVLDAVKTVVKVNGKAATAGQEVGPGDVVVYGITVANTGGRPGTTTLTETVPAGTTYTGGAAEGWACRPNTTAGSTCTQSVTVAATDPVAVLFTVTVDTPLEAHITKVTNTVTSSSGTCSSCTQTNPTRPPALDTVKTLPEVNGAKATLGQELNPGDVLVYHLTVVNTGGRAATTTLKERVPTATRYTGGTAEGWACRPADSAGSVCTQRVPVRAGDTVTVHFTVTVDRRLGVKIAHLTNTVTSSVGTCSSCTLTNPTTPPALVTAKTLAQVNGAAATAGQEVEAGDSLLYHITVHNAGGRAGTTTLTEAVPNATTYTGGAAEGWTCQPDTTAGSRCTQRVTVLARHTVTVPFTVKVDASVPAGTTAITNTVASSTGTCGACTVTDPTHPTASSLVQDKTVNLTTAEPGDTLIYTMTVKNLGPDPAEPVVAYDLLPAGVSLVSIDTHGFGTYNLTTSRWTIGTIEPGQTATLTLVATVNQVTEDTTVTNRFEVIPPGIDPPKVLSACPGSPSESCASTSIVVHPKQIITDLGGPGSGGGIRLAWTLGGGLAALAGALGLFVAFRRLRRLRRPVGRAR